MTTLKEVVEGRKAIIDRMMAIRHRSDICDQFEMTRVLVLPDTVVAQLLGSFYLYGTHFVPGRTPAFAPTVGDLLPTADDPKILYFAVHHPLAIAHRNYLEFYRQHEAILSEYDAFLGSSELRKLLVRIDTATSRALRSCPTTETASFLKDCAFYKANNQANLARLADHLKRHDFAGLATELRKKIVGLSKFKPIDDIFLSASHKKRIGSRAQMVNGELHLTSPAASAEVSWIAHPPSDDLSNAIPKEGLLTMPSIQAGIHSLVSKHSGGGYTKGELYSFQAPTKLIAQLQQAVENHPDLKSLANDAKLWKKGVPEQWDKHYMDAIHPILRRALPQLAKETVLGFHTDFKPSSGKKARTGSVSPVISESQFEKQRELLKGANLRLYTLQVGNLVFSSLSDRLSLTGFIRELSDPASMLMV